MFSGFQKSEILANGFFSAIASQGTEGVIHPQDLAAFVGNDNPIGGRLESNSLKVKLFLRALLLSDVFVNSNDPSYLSGPVAQRKLARPKPRSASVLLVLWFFEVEAGFSVVHHLLVVGTIKIGRFLPGKVVVALANDLSRIFQPCISRKGLVTTQKQRVPVLPEDPLGNSVQDGLKHLPGLVKL